MDDRITHKCTGSSKNRLLAPAPPSTWAPLRSPMHLLAGEKRTDRWKQARPRNSLGKEAHFQTVGIEAVGRQKNFSKLNQRRGLGSNGAPRDLLMHASE